MLTDIIAYILKETDWVWFLLVKHAPNINSIVITLCGYKEEWKMTLWEKHEWPVVAQSSDSWALGGVWGKQFRLTWLIVFLFAWPWRLLSLISQSWHLTLPIAEPWKYAANFITARTPGEAGARPCANHCVSELDADFLSKFFLFAYRVPVPSWRTLPSSWLLLFLFVVPFLECGIHCE